MIEKMLNPGLVRRLFLVFGIFMFSLGCALIPVFKTFIRNIILKHILLTNGSHRFDQWKNSRPAGYLQVKIFDLQNPHEVIKNGEKPFVIEKGVYSYREIRTKKDVLFESNGTISFREEVTYKPNTGNDSDHFTSVNLGLIQIMSMINEGTPDEIKENITALLNASNLFLQTSVRDILWGYKDRLLAEAISILHKNNSDGNNVGIFNKKNNSVTGTYNIYSGKDDFTKLGKIYSYNFLSYLPHWNSETAKMINGSDGTVYPPFLHESDNVSFFYPELCRSFETFYNGTITTRGIDLYQYLLPKRVLENREENDGFCTPPDNCLPSGLLNISTCHPDGLPVIASQPHFYDADHFVQRRIRGLALNNDEYHTKLDIEPMTGLVMNISKKFQVNFFLDNNNDIKGLENINNLYFPVLWIQQYESYDSKESMEFWDNVQIPINITQVVQYSCIVIGTVVLLCVLSQYLVVVFKEKEEGHRPESLRTALLADTERRLKRHEEIRIRK